ncbi:Membrane protein involved in the export of O-antigen and teichoic acid [Consotaella salsifontis]|uniref:Membrane protein involved in the export of O-antigen and teichoic acid n=2 Tax=Consotaella salsifontis TaxID=1365950 RepID=A0A1T4SXP2_9HYPH|nr:Membrane protein involved in the export of O-antigen and teichoic acid [Consotaella salsifontis]
MMHPSLSSRAALKPNFSALNAGGWTAATRVTSQISQFVIILIASRFLGPAEFGVFSLVSAVAYALLRIADAGWSEFIISWRGDESFIEATLTLSLIAGLIMSLLGLLGATFVDEVMASPTEAHLMALFALWIVLATLSSAQGGVLTRRQQVAPLSTILIAAEGVGFAVTVTALFTGADLFSLAYGRLAQQSLQMVASAALTGARPRALPDRAVIREVLAFTRHIFLTRWLNLMRMYASTFLIGLFLGPQSVGLYRAADRLVGALMELMNEPARMLAWLLLRRAAVRAQAEGLPVRETVRETAELMLPLIIAIALPCLALLALFADTVIAFLLGEGWRGAAPIVTILAIARALVVPSSVTEALLSILGEVRRFPPASLINAVISITALAIAAQFDAVAVAVGELVAGTGVLATTIWLQRRYGGVRWGLVARHSLFIVPSIALGLVVAETISQTFAAELPGIMRTLVACAAATVIYAAAVGLLRPVAVRIAFSLWRQQRAAEAAI